MMSVAASLALAYARAATLLYILSRALSRGFMLYE